MIETHGLEKRFGRVRALDGLDLSVDAGEVHGFLGPNGVGKSTTIRVLLGLARASGGSATVFGKDPWNDAVELHKRIAYVPGDVSLWPNLSGGEAIDLLSRLRAGTDNKAAYAARKARLIEVFQLDPSKKGRSYGRARFTVDSDKISSVLPVLTELDVKGLRVAPPSLEELFLRHYGDEINPAEASIMQRPARKARRRQTGEVASVR